MTPMRAAALALLLLAAPCAALVRIEPAAPAVGEPVKVQVFGEFGVPCFTLAATRRVDGRRVAIDVALTRVPGECPQLVASWVVIENLGPLAAGEYEIVVDTASLGGGWGRAPQHLAFSVRSEPVPRPTPYPACFGDCDGNGAVGIDEVMRLVGSASTK